MMVAAPLTAKVRMSDLNGFVDVFWFILYSSEVISLAWVLNSFSCCPLRTRSALVM